MAGKVIVDIYRGADYATKEEAAKAGAIYTARFETKELADAAAEGVRLAADCIDNGNSMIVIETRSR